MCLWFYNEGKYKQTELPYHVITRLEIQLASIMIWFNIKYTINIHYIYINIITSDADKRATTQTQHIT
jgi:hypothetical protein